jgi:phosphoglycerol transferase MdoB-like AlkP superfamily enzyme
METLIFTNNLSQKATNPIFQYTKDFSLSDETKPFIQAACNVSLNEITAALNRTGDSYNVVSICNGSYYILKRAPSNDSLFVTEIETKREVSTMSKAEIILKYYSVIIFVIIAAILLIVLMSATSIIPIPVEVSVSFIFFLSIALISFIIDKLDYKKKVIHETR